MKNLPGLLPTALGSALSMATAFASHFNNSLKSQKFSSGNDSNIFNDEEDKVLIDSNLDREIYQANLDNQLPQKTPQTLEKYAEYVQATMLDISTLGRPASNENLYSENNAEISVTILNSAKEIYELSAKKYLKNKQFMNALINYQNIEFLDNEIDKIKNNKPDDQNQAVEMNLKGAMNKLLQDPDNRSFFKQNPPNPLDQFGKIYYDCITRLKSATKFASKESREL